MLDDTEVEVQENEEDRRVANDGRRTRKSLSRWPKLRSEAGLIYMTDPRSPSIAEVAKNPKFQGISPTTLERWCNEDRWVERRTQFFEAWQQKAQARIGSELCRIRQRDLSDLEEIRKMALEKLHDPLVMAKSWEGVMKVFLEAMEHRERLTDAIGLELMPPSNEPRAAATAADVDILPEEVQIAAREILRSRRAALLAESGIVVEADAPAEAPTDDTVAEAEDATTEGDADSEDVEGADD